VTTSIAAPALPATEQSFPSSVTRHPEGIPARNREVLPVSDNRSLRHNGRMPDAPAGDEPIRVVIADDHPVVRRGLRALLSTLDGIEVVAEAGDGATAVDEVSRHAPDVVLMDLHMPGLAGIDATRQIVASGSPTAVLVLTMFDDDATVLTAIQSGARGYLLKGADQQEIGRALRAVASGEVIFGPEVASSVLGAVAAGQDQPRVPGGFPELSPREREILALLAGGKRTADIAAELYLAPKTVSNALTSIFTKLGVENRAEAIVLAHERGLVVRRAGP
jgi:DNA-binding NarL/FixJ family response regulator